MMSRFPVPVTAIAVVEELSLVLAGRGTQITLLPHSADGRSKLSPAQNYQAFESDHIHGFARLSRGQDDSITFATWGVTKLSRSNAHPKSGVGSGSQLSLQFFGLIHRLPGWILAACTHQKTVRSSQDDVQLLVLTIHNELYRVPHLVHEVVDDSSARIRPLAKGKDVVLYSGHMLAEDDYLLVASGTMFGQVLVWKVDLSATSSSNQATFRSIASFHEHEGSVFGVHIRKRTVQSHQSDLFQVASCSDDRTIRVYNVNEMLSDKESAEQMARTGFTEISANAIARTNVGVSATSSHVSRIWSVLWAEFDHGEASLLSFGEDTTTQLWSISSDQGDSPSGSIHIHRLASVGFHSGKNIWSAAINNDRRSGMIWVYTGGADGRILRHCLSLSENPTTSVTLRLAIPLCDLPPEEETKEERTEISPVHQVQPLFSTLAGNWTVNRILESTRPEYPSGSFDGAAKFTRRKVTDPLYDEELLYEEDGTFSTTSGFSFPARRNYVYRYQRSTNTVTVWFVKTDANDVVDYLFHQVEIDSNRTRSEHIPSREQGLCAIGYHFCTPDHYHAKYNFDRTMEKMDNWTLEFTVTGPEKDYTALSRFERTTEPQQRENSDIFVKAGHDGSKNSETFRSYSWLGFKECLIVTSKGRILVANVNRVMSTPKAESTDSQANEGQEQQLAFDFVEKLTSLAKYSIGVEAPGVGCFLGDGEGNLHLVRRKCSDSDKSGYDLIESLMRFDSKLVFVHAQSHGDSDISLYTLIIQCLKGKKVYWIETNLSNLTDGSTELQSKELQVPSGFDVTSARFFPKDNVLICGCRTGAVQIWRRSRVEGSEGRFESAFADLESLPRLHGRDAVTGIAEYATGPDSSEKAMAVPRDSAISILSTGRDGTLKRHLISLTANKSQVHTMSAITVPVTPMIEGIRVFEDTKRVIVWGFQGTYFTVWDCTEQKELFRTKCGNAYRNWAFKPNEKDLGVGGALVWTQAGICQMLLQPEPSHEVLLSGGHGREMKSIAYGAMKTSGQSKSVHLLATAAEDTEIRLFAVNNLEDQSKITNRAQLDCIATLLEHTTGPTTLRLVPHQCLLFSGGGKEELFAWRIQCHGNSSSPFLPDTLCLAKCDQVTEDGDLRITDIDLDLDCSVLENNKGSSPFVLVTAVYSDSSLRMWSFDMDNPRFELLAETRYTTNCLTCVQHVGLGDSRLLVATSTDGYIVIYAVSPNHGTKAASPLDIMESSIPVLEFQFIQRVRIHQDAIKSLAVCNINRREILVVTGGDDNALAFTRVRAVDIPAEASIQSQTETQGSNNLSHDAAGDSATDPVNPDASTPLLTATVRVPRAHAAAINAIEALEPDAAAKANTFAGAGNVQKFSGDQSRLMDERELDIEHQQQVRQFDFATASNDQTVSTWRVSITKRAGSRIDSTSNKTTDTVNTEEQSSPPYKCDDEISVRRLGRHASVVADAAGLANMGRVSSSDSSNTGRQLLVVAGIGLEILDVAEVTEVPETKHT